jgi:hypothetical protein
MSENLSSGSSGSENLVSPPPRQAPVPAQPAPRRKPATASPQPPEKNGPITADDMKLKKNIKVGKAITLKGDKKQD